MTRTSRTPETQTQQTVGMDCPVITRTVRARDWTQAELLNELTKNNVGLNRYAKTLLAHERFLVGGLPSSVVTVELRVQQLGFANGARSDEILRRAEDLGLEACTLKLAVHLRLQFLEEPDGARITVSSLRISQEDNFPSGFYLDRRDDQPWLRGYYASSDYIWNPNERVVFNSGTGQFLLAQHECT